MISRRQRRLLAGLAVLGLAAPALPALAAPIPVSGRVNGPEGAAVPGARVRLLPQPGAWAQGLAVFRGEADPPAAAEATVDAGGRFRLEAPGSGLWMLIAEAPGRVPVEVRRLALTDPAEIDSAVLFEDVGARFRVFAADGRPAGGALVVLEEEPFFWRSSGGWHPRPRFGRAGAGGAIVLPCARGEVLTARAVGGPGSMDATGEARGVTGGRIALRAGIQREIAVSAEGKPAPGVAVFLPDFTVPVAITGQDGRFSVVVPAGGSALYRLLARDGGRGAGRVAATDPGPLTATLSGLVRSTGRVLSAEDRRPLAGALVWAEMDPGTVVRTDSSGRYTILRSAGDRSLLRAAAAGHQELAWRTGRAQPRGPVLALEPALVVTGTVVDRRGAPVSGAQVRAVPPEPPHSAYYQRRSHGEQAMPEGGNGFRIGGLTRGKVYVIEATAPGFAPIRLELPPLTGDRRVVLAVVPGRTAAGRVIDREDKPMAGVDAVLVASPGRLPLSREDSDGVPGLDVWRARTDADGHFQATNLPPGPLTLRLRKAGFSPLSVRGVEANPEGSLGLWRMTGSDVLRGRVFDERGEPVAGAQVHAGQGFRTLSQGGPPSRKAESVTGADGSFAIPDLFRWDRFDLWIWKEGFQPGIVQNAVAGWEMDGKTGRESRIVLVKGARLAGRVVDETGVPVQGAWLRLVQDGRRQADSSSDMDGRFFLAGLAPGRAALEISAHGLAAETRPVALAVDQPIDGLEAELGSPASAEGRVLSARGLPVQGIKVRAGDFEEAESDADGWWRIDGLTPGKARLTFAPPEGLPLRRELQVSSGNRISRLDVTLPEGREVSGKVRAAAGGAAVAGAIVSVALMGSSPRFETVSGEDGTFRITVDSNGIYDLVARKEGWADTRMPGLRVEGEPLKGLDVRMGPGATLAGRLIDVGVRADVHGARTVRHVRDVRDVRDIAEVEITAFPADRLQITGRVDAQERYEVSDLSPGEWTVEARLRGEIWSAARVTIRPEDIGGAPVLLDLRPNARLDQGEPDKPAPAPPKPPKPPKKTPKKDEEPQRLPRPLILEPVLSSGRRPLTVTVVLAEHGSDRTLLLTREVFDGLARFPEVTHGQWSLLVSATGGALTAVRSVTAGGPRAPVHVELPVAGRLLIRMPREASPATLMLTGPGGHPHSYLGPTGGLQNVFPVVNGIAMAEGVPAGEWEVTVTSSDGQTLLKTHSHTDGTDKVLVLDGP